MQCPDSMALLNPSSAVTEAFETTDDLTLDPTIGYEEDELDIEVSMASKVIEMYGDEISGGVAGEDLRSYEKNAIAFLAGYIAQRNLRKYPCDCCYDDILKTPMDISSPDEMYIEFREYENIDEDAPKVAKLKRPTEKFSQIVGAQLKAYYRLWKKHWPAKGVLRRLVIDIMQSTASAYPEWYDADHPCKEHRLQHLQFLIKVKLFAQTKYNNREAQLCSIARSKQRPNQKLKKLKGL